MITSIPDLLIVGGIALLVFGPKRLPELAKAMGTGIRDFKKAISGESDPIVPTEHQLPPPAENKTH